jgi:hypothetical protein
MAPRRLAQTDQITVECLAQQLGHVETSRSARAGFDTDSSTLRSSPTRDLGPPTGRIQSTMAFTTMALDGSEPARTQARDGTTSVEPSPRRSIVFRLRITTAIAIRAKR